MAETANDRKEFCYHYSRPKVTSDLVVFGYEPGKEIHLLLQYKNFEDEGFAYPWALPGRSIHGSKDPDNEYGEGVETLDECMKESLVVRADIVGGGVNKKDCLVCEFDLAPSPFLEYLPPRTEPERDKRGKRVISLPVMVFIRMVEMSGVQKEFFQWVPISRIMEDNPRRAIGEEKKRGGEFGLPFDHDIMFYDGYDRLQQVVRVQPIGEEILREKNEEGEAPKSAKFTISQLLQLYEAIFGGSIEKSGFRKWLLDDKRNLIKPLGDYDHSSSNRPAQFYEFNKDTYDYLKRTKELDFNPTITRKR